MAVHIDSTTNLHLIDAAESLTGWSWSGITKTAISTFSREGTNSVGGQVAINTFGFGYHTHGSSINLTTAGNERVYIWASSVGPGTYAQEGWSVVIGDGTNIRAYRVGGSDVVPFMVKGWFCLMLDTANLPATYQTIAGAAAPDLTAITQFGGGIYNTVAPSGNALNIFFDVVRYGSGIIVGSESGDDITLADIADDDFSSNAGKAYGIIREIQTGVYGVQGDIIFGNTSGSSIDFKDQDAVVVFEDHVEGTGQNTPFKFNGEHSSTGTFRTELGVAVSSGDDESGRNGVIFVNANPDDQPIDFDFSDSDIEDIFLYGCTLTGLTGTVKFSDDATNGVSHHLSGCSFANCGQVDTGRTVVRNCTFSGYTSGSDAALLWNDNNNVKYCNFLGNTDDTEDPHAIEHPDAGEYTYYDMVFSGNDYDIYFTDTSGSLVINASGTSNPETYETTSGSVVINNTKNYTLESLIVGSEVRAYVGTDPMTATYLDGVESSGSSFSFEHQEGGNVGYINIHKEQYVPITINLTYPSSDTAIPISQRIDYAYDNP
jgi:hypothetical protein